MSQVLQQVSTLLFLLNAGNFCCFTFFYSTLSNKHVLFTSRATVYPLTEGFLPVAAAKSEKVNMMLHTQVTL